MTDLYLLEPPRSSAWFPFQDSRPVAELRAGAWLIRERWEAVADAETRQIFGPPHLHGFAEEGVPDVAALHAVRGPALIGRSDFAPAGVRPGLPAGPARLTHDGTVVGWSVPEGTEWREGSMDGPAVEIEGLLLRGAFDLLTALELLLAPDAADLTVERGDDLPDGCIVIGDSSDVILLGATVEPGVTFDVREGAVVIERAAYVKGGTRFEGPVFIGPGTEVHGGQIRASAIGPRCKVRGEVSTSVFLGYANKVHEGFVGHSVVGRWANLGAGTTTSNLKNTYGPVRLTVGADTIETDRVYLGSLIGDHAKTAIGTLLQTGTAVGTGASLFCDGRPPRFVPPFAWGGVGAARMQRDGFLTTAGRVLGRRKVPFTDEMRRSFERIYDFATGVA